MELVEETDDGRTLTTFNNNSRAVTRYLGGMPGARVGERVLFIWLWHDTDTDTYGETLRCCKDVAGHVPPLPGQLYDAVLPREVTKEEFEAAWSSAMERPRQDPIVYRTIERST